MLRVHWLILILLGACADSPAWTPRSVEPPGPAPAGAHAAIAARARADTALHEDVVLDYERPFEAKPFDRSAIAKLYTEACHDGDKRSCLIAAQLLPLDDGGETYRAVEANCLAGDQISCRALPPDDHAQRFPTAPGAMSRRAECQKPKLPAPCDADALRRECNEGFPVACSEVGSVYPPLPDSGTMMDQWASLSLRGCEGNIASECENVAQAGNDHTQFEMSQRLCDLRPQRCAELSFVYKHRGDKAAERETLERACEYGGTWGACLLLAEGYIEGRFEEPTPGRGQALLEWSCSKLAAAVKTDPFAHYPACKSIKEPQSPSGLSPATGSNLRSNAGSNGTPTRPRRADPEGPPSGGAQFGSASSHFVAKSR